jgi:regulator of sirC expression with transglutaminase-like and TPR domain
MSPIEKVSVINDILYDNYNFRGDKKNYHSPENSSFGSYYKPKKEIP